MTTNMETGSEFGSSYSPTAGNSGSFLGGVFRKLRVGLNGLKPKFGQKTQGFESSVNKSEIIMLENS